MNWAGLGTLHKSRTKPGVSGLAWYGPQTPDESTGWLGLAPLLYWWNSSSMTLLRLSVLCVCQSLCRRRLFFCIQSLILPEILPSQFTSIE